MPHKRNPILSENLTGLARLIRSSVTPALENAVLWHERDISHSSVERIIAPDATVLTDFAISRLTGVIEKLLIYPDRMQKNMEMLKGLVFSQSLMLALTESGMKREDAYKIVQGYAMKVWAGEGDFLAYMKSDAEVAKHLNAAALDKIFDYNRYTKNIGQIIDRVLAA